MLPEDNPRAVKPDGLKIRFLRKKKGWTQERMVEQIGALPRPRTLISKKTLENAESGRHVLIATLATIARVLGTTVCDLMLTVETDETVDPSRKSTDETVDPTRKSSDPQDELEPALHRDLFRVEGNAQVDEPGKEANLSFGVGFFRSLVEGVGSPTAPVFCGCASATVCFGLDSAESRGDPCFTAVPADTTAKVEYGSGTAPSVRFESVAVPRLLDGRGGIDIAVTGIKEERLRVGVTIDPEWFSCYCPAKPDLDGAQKVALETILRKWWRPSIWNFEWGAGDARTAED